MKAYKLNLAFFKLNITFKKMACVLLQWKLLKKTHSPLLLFWSVRSEQGSADVMHVCTNQDLMNENTMKNVSFNKIN